MILPRSCGRQGALDRTGDKASRASGSREGMVCKRGRLGRDACRWLSTQHTPRCPQHSSERLLPTEGCEPASPGCTHLIHQMPRLLLHRAQPAAGLHDRPDFLKQHMQYARASKLAGERQASSTATPARMQRLQLQTSKDPHCPAAAHLASTSNCHPFRCTLGSLSQSCASVPHELLQLGTARAQRGAFGGMLGLAPVALLIHLQGGSSGEQARCKACGTAGWPGGLSARFACRLPCDKGR